MIRALFASLKSGQIAILTSSNLPVSVSISVFVSVGIRHLT